MLNATKNRNPKLILVVDDEADVRSLLSRKLLDLGFQVDAASGLKEAFGLIGKKQYSAVLLDMVLEDGNGIEAIHEFLSRAPFTRIVMNTGHSSVEVAVKAMSRGASGFLVKTENLDQNLNKFCALINDHPSYQTGDIGALKDLGIIGDSQAMAQVASKVLKLKQVDSTVLISGESGTGKELIARAIHKFSQRASGPFLAINCAAIAENILESELFGYKRGAFTDAKTDRKGYFETCSGGTLLLDEIAEMSPNLQAKLLRVLQEKEVTPLGSCIPVPINTRIIAATNKVLKDEVKSGKFREDLYYRLAVFQIGLPPLRERRSDIPDLVSHYLKYYNERFSKSVATPPNGLLAHLQAYEWPGNIRELQNAVERAVVLSDDNQLQLEDLLPMRRGATSVSEALDGEAPGSGLGELPLNFQAAKDAFEHHYIAYLLRATHGNVAEAARVSGQYRPNVYRLIRRYHIDPQNFKYGRNEVIRATT